LDSITVADLSNKTKPEVVYGLRMKSNKVLTDRTKREEAAHAPDAVEVV
jgi:hypothetical protein